jgi:hypothetical protein
MFQEITRTCLAGEFSCARKYALIAHNAIPIAMYLAVHLREYVMFRHSTADTSQIAEAGALFQSPMNVD